MPLRFRTAKIPLNINSKENIIVLRVLLSGKKSARLLKMVLDTGASLTTIPTEVALAIGLDPSKPKKRIEMITASGIEYVPVVMVPRIKLLGFMLKNVEAVCLNLPPQGLVSGLLGLNILSKFNLRLVFLKKFLELSK